MLQARRSSNQGETPTEAEEGAERERRRDYSVGSAHACRSRIDLYSNGFNERRAKVVWYAVPILAAIAITAISSDWIHPRRCRSGARSYLAVNWDSHSDAKMMGLLLTAIAIQFMLNGLTDIGIVKRRQ